MKRVLFVDDEPNILDALRRMLRSQRHEWDMAFATSGEDALSKMEEEPFDVVVSDMRMPGMDGAELLGKIAERHPSTIRIVLSGQSDMDAAMRSVSVSHQFLAKPCGGDTLRAVIERSCGLTELLRDPDLQSVIGGMKDLPVLPRTYQALLAALAEEEVDVEQVSNIVEQDAGIAGKILHIVNGSFFGIRKEITDLRLATAYLGVHTIRDLVLSFELFQQFQSESEPGSFSFERLQTHSFLTARIARRLLREKTAADQAFLAALLHDVGKLVLATRLPAEYQQVLEAGAGVDRPFHRVEEEVLGVSHAEIGAYLLGLWGLPHPVVEAVAYHHSPARVPGQETIGVLAATHLADALTLEQSGCEPRVIELDETYLESLGIGERLPEWRSIAAAEASDPQHLPAGEIV